MALTVGVALGLAGLALKAYELFIDKPDPEKRRWLEAASNGQKTLEEIEDKTKEWWGTVTTGIDESRARAEKGAAAGKEARKKAKAARAAGKLAAPVLLGLFLSACSLCPPRITTETILYEEQELAVEFPASFSSDPLDYQPKLVDGYMIIYAPLPDTFPQ